VQRQTDRDPTFIPLRCRQTPQSTPCRFENDNVKQIKGLPLLNGHSRSPKWAATRRLKCSREPQNMSLWDNSDCDKGALIRHVIMPYISTSVLKRSLVYAKQSFYMASCTGHIFGPGAVDSVRCRKPREWNFFVDSIICE
jgi:hypothetical protein